MFSDTNQYTLRGMCGAAAAQAAIWPTIGSALAIAPDVGAGLFTDDLKSLTVESVGCDCARWVFSADMSARVARDCDAAVQDAAATKVFWQTETAWSLRQTTCGADTGTVCTATRPQAFFSNAALTASCSLKTEHLLVVPTPTFVAAIGQPVQTGVYSWVVNSYTTGKTPAGIFGALTTSRFLYTQNTNGASVETIGGIGGLLPTAFITSRSSFGGGGVSNYVFTGADTMRIVWQLNGYVQQESTVTERQTVFFGEPIFDTFAATLTFRSGALTATCLPWQLIPAGGPQFLMNETTYTCAQPDAAGQCSVASINTLPQSVLASTTPQDMASKPNWAHYFMTIVCDVTSSVDFATYENVEIPPSTLNIFYGLVDEAGEFKTDIRDPPFFSFVQTGLTLNGVSASEVNFELQSDVVAIPESVLSSSNTLTDIFYNDLSPVGGSIPYSGAFAFRVELADVLERPYWTVHPKLVLIAAHSEAQPASGYSTVTPDSPLDVGFCGINASNSLLGVLALVDTGAATDAGSPYDALFDADGWLDLASNPALSGMGAVLTPGLLSAIQEIVGDADAPMLAAMQANLLPNVASTLLSGQHGMVTSTPEGGFAIPMRHRFSVASQSAFYLSLCSIVDVEPYVPFSAFGSFPAYGTREAALADTAIADGAAAEPIAVAGYTLSPTDGDTITYFFPSLPASTGGKICTASSTDIFSNAIGFVLPATDPACVALRGDIPRSQRRRLAAIQRPFILPLDKALASNAKAGSLSPSIVVIVEPAPRNAPRPRLTLEDGQNVPEGRHSWVTFYFVAAFVGLTLCVCGGAAASKLRSDAPIATTQTSRPSEAFRSKMSL